MRRNGRGWGRAFLAAGVVLAGVAASTGADAATLEITSDYRFTSNVTCDSTPCIRITGSNVRVSGRGFTVSCVTNGSGVEITGANVTLTGLTLDGCGVAVVVQPTGANAALRQVDATAFTSTGFSIEGAYATVLGCSATSSNPSGGVGFIVHPDATGTKVQRNIASSCLVGIFLNGAVGASIIGNQTDAETLYGIWAGSSSSDNLISRNEAFNNGTYDLSDATAGCGTNEWVRNRFATDNETGTDAGPGAGCIQ